MLTVKLYRYTIPCQTGVVLRKQPLTERQGLILQLEQDGKIGWGEIAPLPGFSLESLADAEQQTRNWIINPTEDLENLAPSVAFGISCALAELNGELAEDGDFRSAILCDGDIPKFAAKIAQQAKPLGKIKVGFAPEKEGELANQLLNQFPDLNLRLDANRAFSLENAISFGKKITKNNRLRIQFIEEPCTNPTLSREFAQQTGIAIAWDESVREPDFKVMKENHLRAIVIKPMLVGSLKRCVNFIERAHQQGLSVVISSSIESSLGLTQLARIAKQYTPEMVAGLDTLHLMQFQLIRKWQGSNLPLVELDNAYITRLI